MKFKNAYSETEQVPFDTGPGLTEQHHQAACDINNIMDKYTVTGLLPDVVERIGVYGDFSDVEDFLGAQIRIKQAEEAFMLLDAKIRKRFQNSPAGLMEFLADPNNREEAQKLGLVNSEPITPVKDSLAAPEPSK